MQFKLRPWTINDLNSLVEYANNFNIAKNLANAFPHPYCKEDGMKFIEIISKQNPTQVFAICFPDESPPAVAALERKPVEGLVAYEAATPFTPQTS